MCCTQRDVIYSKDYRPWGYRATVSQLEIFERDMNVIIICIKMRFFFFSVHISSARGFA